MVVSEDEDRMFPFEALDNLGESVSKGSLLKRPFYSIALQKNKKLKTATSALSKTGERETLQYLSGLNAGNERHQLMLKH